VTNELDTPRGGVWQPGQSGNPGGRPRELKAFRQQVREHGPEAISHVLDVMRDSEAENRDRLNAASLLLAYGFGRPQALPPVEDVDNEPTLVSDQELARRIYHVLRRVQTREPTIEGEVVPVVDVLAEQALRLASVREIEARRNVEHPPITAAHASSEQESPPPRVLTRRE
jgi:hypothetical protein